MSQIRIHVELPKDEADRLSPMVETLFEEDGFPVASFEISETEERWAVSVYAPQDEASAVTDRLAALLKKQSVYTAIQTETLDDRNWVAATLEDLAPVRAGRFVVHGSHDAGCAAPNEHAILVDAGMAFGTGHHGTTAGCLAMIDRELKRSAPRNALDLGSGTGVLAIAVALARRIPVLATDIDPVAADIARENARINRVGNFVESIAATGFNHRRFVDYVPFDLVIANILAGPLQAMAHDLAAHLSPGGTVILSGLLPHQKARILATYRTQGLAFEQAHYRDGWMTLVLKNMR